MKTLKKRLLCDLICVIGVSFLAIGLEILHSVSFVIIGVVVCGYGIYLSWKLVRCPVCERYLRLRGIFVEYCPYCGAELP